MLVSQLLRAGMESARIKDDRSKRSSRKPTNLGVRTSAMNRILALRFITSPGYADRRTENTLIVLARTCLAIGLVFIHIPAVSGEELPEPPPAAVSQTAQVIYKGVVGNLLEGAPLESEQRVQLQRMNAVLSNPLSARTLAVALGIANPPLMIAGLIWGLWSASQISSTSRSSAAQPPHQPALAYNPSSDRSAARGTLDDLSSHGGGGSPSQPALRSSHIVSASALASVAGGAAPGDRGLPCTDCVMPMLSQQRVMPATK
jgi:hypothetical protein